MPMKAVTTPKTTVAGKTTENSDSESSDGSDSEEDAPIKTIFAKGAPTKLTQSTINKTTAAPKTFATATPNIPATGKKGKRLDIKRKDDSECKEEAPAKTVLDKGTRTKPIQSTTSKMTAAPKTFATATDKVQATSKKSNRTNSESSDDFESGEQTLTFSAKGIPAKSSKLLPVKMSATLKTCSTAIPKVQAIERKAESLDYESTDDSDSEEENEKASAKKPVLTGQIKALAVKPKAAKAPEPAKPTDRSSGGTAGEKVTAVAKKTSKGKEVESKSSSSQANPK
ncbi:treacle protein-like, partial [Arapaima gigas]